MGKAIKAIVGGGAEKPQKQDTKAVDAQLALQRKQQEDLDAQTAARLRSMGSRAKGRQLLLANTGDLGVKSASLGGA